MPMSGLGALGVTLSANNGESLRVCRVPSHPGWIYKEYRAALSDADIKRLDRLIALPSTMTPADRALVEAHASWPVSRVVDGRRSVGVLIPIAPDSFRAELQTRPGKTVSKTLEIDMLAQSADQQAKLKLPPQQLTDRMEICATLARVGALFERHGVVYLDWSYANVFWSAGDQSVYVIDMDGCSFGPRPQIETPNWADPLVPRHHLAGNESDRYRVALLIGRCLTSERGDPSATQLALRRLRGTGEATKRVVDLLIKTLSADQVSNRSSLVAVSAALDTATGAVPAAGGVTGWRTVGGASKSPRVPPRAASSAQTANGASATRKPTRPPNLAAQSSSTLFTPAQPVSSLFAAPQPVSPLVTAAQPAQPSVVLAGYGGTAAASSASSPSTGSRGTAPSKTSGDTSSALLGCLIILLIIGAIVGVIIALV
jgi:hypothetical protein